MIIIHISETETTKIEINKKKIVAMMIYYIYNI